jgi:hypothetical protein
MSSPFLRLYRLVRRHDPLGDVPAAIGASDAELVRLTTDPIVRERARWDRLRLLLGRPLL